MSTWRPLGSEREPRRVGELLDRVTRSVGAPSAGTFGAIFSGWNSIVGEEIAAHAAPRSLRDGVLQVEVDQPAWATQLGYLSSELLARIAGATGSDEVSSIQFRVSWMARKTGFRRGPAARS